MWGPLGSHHFFIILCVKLICGSHGYYYFSRMNCHVSVTSAKTAIKTAEGPPLPGFRKLGDESYPVLRFMDENQTGRQIEGPKVNLFLCKNVHCPRGEGLVLYVGPTQVHLKMNLLLCLAWL